MPSPVGHALGGFAVGWLAARSSRLDRPLLTGLVFAGLGVLPDVDIVVEGTHRLYTHSIAAVGLIGLLGSSIRVTNDARYRAEAANLANAMIADMWTTTPANIDTFTTAKLPTWATKVATLLPGGIAPDVAITPGFTAESRTVVVTVYWKLPGESDKHQHIMTAQIGKNAP